MAFLSNNNINKTLLQLFFDYSCLLRSHLGIMWVSIYCCFIKFTFPWASHFSITRLSMFDRLEILQGHRTRWDLLSERFGLSFWGSGGWHFAPSSSLPPFKGQQAPHFGLGVLLCIKHNKACYEWKLCRLSSPVPPQLSNVWIPYVMRQNLLTQSFWYSMFGILFHSDKHLKHLRPKIQDLLFQDLI